MNRHILLLSPLHHPVNFPLIRNDCFSSNQGIAPASGFPRTSVYTGQRGLHAEILQRRGLPPDNQTPPRCRRTTVRPLPRLSFGRCLPSDPRVSRSDRESNIGSTRKRFPWGRHFFGKTQHSFIFINHFAFRMKAILIKLITQIIKKGKKLKFPDADFLPDLL